MHYIQATRLDLANSYSAKISYSLATHAGMNVRIFESASPNVPPKKSNGKIGPPSKPVAKDVLVSKALTSTISKLLGNI
jgi:hypothetical protein